MGGMGQFAGYDRTKVQVRYSSSYLSFFKHLARHFWQLRHIGAYWVQNQTYRGFPRRRPTSRTPIIVGDRRITLSRSCI